ncbi:hypothetical protein DY000_02041163 [Brassica cretica]|uniref:MADS-box domain-containing protein n=1 Tax=Brassica cretica TaxID=69181 RepID=A0ABQ7BQE2_BRACR|nr:hypothetical protein DY000_02041163 [Brassica cretica]
MAKSKKKTEKEGIEINDGGDSSSFDLTLLKEAIENVPTKKKNPFDLTSMSLAISTVDRKCSKRKRNIKSKAETMQRLRTLLMICDKYSYEVLASDRMKCAKTNNFRLGHKLKTVLHNHISGTLLMAIIRHTYHRLMHLYLQRHPPYGAYTQAPSGYIPHGPPISRLLNPSSAQGVPDPSSDVRNPRAAPARDLFLVHDSIRQLASDDQGVPDQATKDVCDPIEATRSILARVPFVSSSRLNSFGDPIQQSSKNLPCDTTTKRSDKVSTARLRENDAVRLIDQPLQPSDRPSIPSNLQTLESITSQKALRSLMDWGGLTVEDGFDHPTRPEE